MQACKCAITLVYRAQGPMNDLVLGVHYFWRELAECLIRGMSRVCNEAWVVMARP